MNRFLTTILLLYGLNLGIAAQSPDPIFSIFQKSNFVGLTPNLAKEVDLCLINDQNFSSRTRTIERLISFFSTQSILSVEPIYEGSSKNKSSSYKVAKVTTKNGKKYKLFLYQEVIGGKSQIAEIRVENFNE